MNAKGRPARIVFLNGAGSAGKSSIARELQAIAMTPFLVVAMDTFLDMLPEALQDHPDAFAYRPTGRGGPPSIAIETGPVGERLLAGMRRAIVVMAEAGNDLIVDDVLLSGKAEYRRMLAPFNVMWVAVTAPLEVLETRELARGDRMPGLARWQFDRVHSEMDYDLEVDTAHASPRACAETIRDRFGL